VEFHYDFWRIFVGNARMSRLFTVLEKKAKKQISWRAPRSLSEGLLLMYVTTTDWSQIKDGKNYQDG